MEIGERIKNRRIELGMTQEELAHKLGYGSKTTIAKIEANANQLRQNKIKSIADALSTTPGYIMGWRDDPNEIPYLEDTPLTRAKSDFTLLTKYDALTPANKIAVMTMIESLLSSQENS